MDAPSPRTDTDKPRRTRGGTSPHFGFRLDPTTAARIEAIGAALGLRNEAMSLPAPDRSDVMRAIVLEGLPPLEAKLGIASPPSAPATPRQGALPFAAPSGGIAPAPARPAVAPAEHEAPKAPPAAARASSARGAGKVTAKPGKASKSAKRAKGKG